MRIRRLGSVYHHGPGVKVYSVVGQVVTHDRDLFSRKEALRLIRVGIKDALLKLGQGFIHLGTMAGLSNHIPDRAIYTLFVEMLQIRVLEGLGIHQEMLVVMV